jgi:hypothetical protein
MPIATDEWKQLIQGALTRLSDAGYQRLAWFNQHEEQTSPDEQINQLLGDYDFAGFVRSQQIGLSREQQAIASDLMDEMKSYGGKSAFPINPYNAIDDPKWVAIRSLSRSVLDSLFRNKAR